MERLSLTIFALFLAPLIPGIINRVKALFAGRTGQPLFQTYNDIFKLLRKGATYSKSTTWIFRAAPVVSMGALILAIFLLPLGEFQPLFSFEGDIILFAYLLALSRFVVVLAALDTASSFEGMGASREVWFSAIAEPALFIALATLAKISHSLSLDFMLNGINSSKWFNFAPALCLLIVSLFIVMLAENSRIPFDDPNTHLELTMIHEVMVLDYSGPDFAFVLYGSCLKLFIFSALIANIAVPFEIFSGWQTFAIFAGAMFIIAVLVGIVESTMARLRMFASPQLLAGAGALSFIAFLISSR